MQSIKLSFLKSSLLFLFFCCAQSLSGQRADMPRPSPKASLGQTIGVTNINVHYSRLAAKGRKLFGYLIPFGKVWRTGANEATTISFEHDLKFCGQDVKVGTYALFTIPGEKKWTIILNKNPEQFRAYNYDSELDLFRAEVTSESGPFVELFTMLFSEVNLSNGVLQLQWGNARINLPISV